MEDSLYTKRRISDLTKRTYSSLSISSYTGSSQKIDNRPPVVIEIGTRLTRIGFAGELTPRDIFCTKYVDPLTIETHSVFNKEYSTDEQHLMLVKFIKDIVFRKLLTTINERRVIIIESVLTPTKIRNAIAKAFFECSSLSPYSLLFAPSHLLCTFPFNAKSCVVVDIGSEETTLFPIAEGCLMLNNFESTSLSADSLEKNVENLLRKYAKIRGCFSEESTGKLPLRNLSDEDLSFLKKNNIIEDIIVRFCFATTKERGEKLQKHLANESYEIDLPPPDIELPFSTETLIVPGIVREAAAEIFFAKGDCDHRSIAQLILDAIVQIPIDLRKIFLSRLLIVGGVARTKGFLSRLKTELLCFINDKQSDYHKRLGGLKTVAFYLFDENINLELYCAWLGGSMFGICDVLESRSITRENWLAQELTKRVVPDWTDRIDNYFESIENMPRTRQ